MERLARHCRARPSPLGPDLSGDARKGRNVTSSRQARVRPLHARWRVFGVSVSAGLQDKASAMTSDCANPDLTGPRMISIPCIQCRSRRGPRFEAHAASAARGLAIGVPSTNIYNSRAGVRATRASPPGARRSRRGSSPSHSARAELAGKKPKLRAIPQRASRS